MPLNQLKMMMLLTVLFSSGTVFAQSYTFERLAPLSGGSRSYAKAINNSGVVVGTTEFIATCFGCGGTTRATIWNNSVATELWSGQRHSDVYDINDSGQAVGDGVPGYTTDSNAYKWNSLPQETIRLTSLYDHDGARAINNRGQVAGNVSNSSGSGSAVVWDSNGTATYFGQGFFVYDINDAGLIIGTSANRAAIWDSQLGAAVFLDNTSSFSEALAFNNSGLVVGYSVGGGTGPRATLWNNNTKVDLGTLGGVSYAVGINAKSQIVGRAYTNEGISHAMLWDGTAMTDLNSYLGIDSVNEGWILDSASGINDVGQIVGVATNSITGENRAFVLTPVPEPESYAMMLAGLGLISFVGCRRKQKLKALKSSGD